MGDTTAMKTPSIAHAQRRDARYEPITQNANADTARTKRKITIKRVWKLLRKLDRRLRVVEQRTIECKAAPTSEQSRVPVSMSINAASKRYKRDRRSLTRLVESGVLPGRRLSAGIGRNLYQLNIAECDRIMSGIPDTWKRGAQP